MEDDETVNWSPWHDQLHRHLLQRSGLLPKGQAILLAVSGGQDSMALLGLARDLIRHHHWTLHVWHGNHGWHQDAQRCCDELKVWCQEQDFVFFSDTANPVEVQSEAKARAWRYHCLETTARRLKAVVSTAHTATDKTETFLLQLARGTDLRGLSSLREQRPLSEQKPEGIQLSRPMLIFKRKQTLEICRALKVPIWNDPTNASALFARNRIRNEVLPVLEELYPGCDGRISNLSERLSKTHDIQQELVDQCLKANETSNQQTRQLISNSSLQLRRILMNRWMTQRGTPQLNAIELDRLCRRLGPSQPPGKTDLAGGWQISWTKHFLRLDPPDSYSHADTHRQG